MKSEVAVDLATCMFRIAFAKDAAVPSSKRNPSGFVGMSLATKHGFISRALLGGQPLEHKRKIVRKVGQVFSFKHYSINLQLGFASTSSPLLHPQENFE